MATDTEVEVFRALRSAQNRYDYFLLAAAGAAIAFALNQTKDAVLSWTLAPLGLAILFWGLSFYFGCRHLLYVSSALWSNGELLKVQAGDHPMTGRNPQLIQLAVEGIHGGLKKNEERSMRLAHWQFSTIIIGAIFYIGWHIWEMYLRAINLS